MELQILGMWYVKSKSSRQKKTAKPGEKTNQPSKDQLTTIVDIVVNTIAHANMPVNSKYTMDTTSKHLKISIGFLAFFLLTACQAQQPQWLILIPASQPETR